MTIIDFQKKYCQMCGTQQCHGEVDDISNCGKYKGNIKGIPKKKSLIEILNELNPNWIELIRKEFNL